MKYLIIAGAFFCLCNHAQAQTTGSNSSNATTHSSETSHKAKATKKKGAKKEKAQLNHRRVYKWKTGQRATPTGQEATGLGSGYSATKKDTAGKRED